MTQTLNLPNRLTISRLFLSVIFFGLLTFYSQQSPKPWMLDVAIGLFVVAAITDVLDGYLARKRNEVTPLGRVLDPFADKILICGAFILFTGPGFVDATGRNVTEVQAWMVVLIVGRELLVTSLRGFSESIGRAFPASLHGKLKMWMQSFAAPCILLIVAHEKTWLSADWVATFKVTIVWLTVVVTALSTLQYIARSRFILQESIRP